MKNILFLLIVAFIGYSVITTPEVSEKIQIHLAAIQRHALEIAKEKASQVIAEHGDEIVSALTTQLQGAAPSSQNAQPGLTKLYTNRQITETTGAGVRSIPAGSSVQIVSMNGDNISVTDGSVIVTTTPDALTDVTPAHIANQPPSQGNMQGATLDTTRLKDAVQEFLDAQYRNAGVPQGQPSTQTQMQTNTSAVVIDPYGTVPVSQPQPAYAPPPPARPAQPLTANEIYNEKIRAQIEGIDQQITHLEREIENARQRDRAARFYGNSSSHRVTISRHNMEIQRLQNRKHNLISQMR